MQVKTSSTQEIGKKIRALRLMHDMTQTELAKKIGVTHATINKYELGQVNFPRDRIELLAKALGVLPSYLLGWDDTESLDHASDSVIYLSAKNAMDKADFFYSANDGNKLIIEEKGAEPKTPSLNKIKPYLDLALSPEDAEILRIYKSLDVKSRNKLLQFAWELEDKRRGQ